MVPQLQNKAVRYSLFAMWLLMVGGALYLYFFEREFVQRELQSAFSASIVVGSIIYFLLGSFRAFTLVPATALRGFTLSTACGQATWGSIAPASNRYSAR